MCRHAFLSDLVGFGCWRLNDCSPVLSLLVTSAPREPEPELDGSSKPEEVNTNDKPEEPVPLEPVPLTDCERGETFLSSGELIATNIVIVVLVQLLCY